MFAGTPFRVLKSGCFLSAYSFCCGFWQSSSCCGCQPRSFCSGLHPCSSGAKPICSSSVQLGCCDRRRCSSCFFRRCRFQLQPALSGGEWQRPSGRPRSETLSTATQRPCARLCATRSCCSSFPDPIHSSCRRRLPCSPSPTRAVPPHVVRHHASHSLPRCVRLSAAACWCKTTYRPVA
jgi:hypothetical protein